MCLTEVKQIYDPPDPIEGIAYKIGLIKNGKFVTECDQHPYDFNVWHHCRVSPCHCLFMGRANPDTQLIEMVNESWQLTEETYPLGFHAYLKPLRPNTSLVCVKIKYKNAVALGYQDEHRVVVAQDVMFLEII